MLELLHSGQLARAHTHTHTHTHIHTHTLSLARERKSFGRWFTVVYKRVSCAACSLSSWQDVRAVVRGRASLHARTQTGKFSPISPARTSSSSLPHKSTWPRGFSCIYIYIIIHGQILAHIPSPKHNTRTHNTLHAHKGFTPRTRVNHILCIYILYYCYTRAGECAFLSLFFCIIFPLTPPRSIREVISNNSSPRDSLVLCSRVLSRSAVQLPFTSSFNPSSTHNIILYIIYVYRESTRNNMCYTHIILCTRK